MDPHPLAVAPEVSDEQYRVLRESIAQYGVFKPIMVYDGQILDGRARYKACRELGLSCPTTTFYGGEDEALEYATKNNKLRIPIRERQRMIAPLLRLRPNASLRYINRLTGCNLAIVARYKDQLTQTGEIPDVIVPVSHRLTGKLDEAIDLFEQGYDRHQVAQMVGAKNSSYLLTILKKRRGYVPAHGATFRGRGQKLSDTGRILEESVTAITGIAQGLKLVRGKVSGMAPETAILLLGEMRDAMRIINRAVAQLREVARNGD